MACDSGSDSDLGCFLVTHFSDHYDIGVLTEDRTEGCRKGHACLCINLALVDAFDVLLDRVFDCDYVNVGLCKLTKSCVKGGCFTGTGRSCYQHNALRNLDKS